jgi:hypothetical protein
MCVHHIFPGWSRTNIISIFLSFELSKSSNQTAVIPKRKLLSFISTEATPTPSTAHFVIVTARTIIFTTTLATYITDIYLLLTIAICDHGTVALV